MKKWLVYVSGGGLLIVVAGILTQQSHFTSPEKGRRDSQTLAPHQITTQDQAPRRTPPPASPVTTTLSQDKEEPVDAGQSTEEGLRDLGKQIEESIQNGDMVKTAQLISIRSLLQVSAGSGEEAGHQKSDFQLLHLRDMESYAKTYPELLQSYDYQLTLLAPAFSAEDIDLLEMRVASIRNLFPQKVAQDNDCISYFLAIRRKDPDAATWQAPCESSLSPFSYISKELAKTIEVRLSR